jgi:DNA (cytosine-5)-methyltransferase 1
LWFEYAKAISYLRPGIALIENVPAIVGRGLDIVLADLASLGYDAEWFNLSASDVGAWHKRERIFIIAYALRGGCDGGGGIRKGRHLSHNEERNMEKTSERRQGERQPTTGKMGDVPDTIGKQNNAECERQEEPDKFGWNSLGDGKKTIRQENREANNNLFGGCGINVPDTTRVEIWAVEPDVDRVADGVPSRVDRIKCLGNAVVPQVAQVIGEMILEVSRGEKGDDSEPPDRGDIDGDEGFREIRNRKREGI